MVVRVKVADIIVSSNAHPNNNIAEFDLMVEAAATDTFSSVLSKLSKAFIGEVTAVLNGK